MAMNPHRARRPVEALSEQVINQIAAGEVVERPASVVKELLENALDAGATRIRIEVDEGGARRIRITDDGWGMSPEDAQKALLRHATSKLRSAEDLESVATLGFRGEALPSIASVSRFCLQTRTAEAEMGFEIRKAGGAPLEIAEVGAPKGTTVEVCDLFFNQPARLKFLRRPATELGHISEMVHRACLLRPDLSLSLISQGRAIFEVFAASAQDPKDRLRRILGSALSEKLYPIKAPLQAGSVEVTGFLGEPTADQRTTKGLYFFVNGRFVRDRTLQHAVMDAYRNLLERGRYPVALLFVKVGPGLVDVNVHPQKTEVRFADSQAVHREVSQCLRRTLDAQPWLAKASGLPSLNGDPQPDRDPQPGSVAPLGRVAPPTGRALGDDLSRFVVRPKGYRPESSFERRAGRVREPDPPIYVPTEGRQPWSERSASVSEDLFSRVPAGGFFSQLRPIGQLGGIYLLAESRDQGLVVIDQHAAHERVLFASLLSAAEAGLACEEPLLMPLQLELGGARQQAAEAYQGDLLALGFAIEPFGGQSWLLKSCPKALREADLRALLLDLLDLLVEEQPSELVARLEALCARAACHKAVRAGDRLSLPEIDALFEALDRAERGAHCPHGRPVFVRFDAKELAKWFHRS